MALAAASFTLTNTSDEDADEGDGAEDGEEGDAGDGDALGAAKGISTPAMAVTPRATRERKVGK